MTIWSRQPNMVYTGTNYFTQYPAVLNVTPKYEKNAAIETDDSWTIVPATTWASGLDTPKMISSMVYQQSQLMQSGVFDDGVDTYCGIAISTDEGVTWSIIGDTNYDNTYECLSVAYNGSRYVMDIMKASDSAIIVRYSDDDGTSWNTVTGCSFTGNQRVKVKHINSQFIVVGNDGIYYSAAGATYTYDAVHTDCNDIAYDGVNYVAVGCDTDAANTAPDRCSYTPNFSTAWTDVAIGHQNAGWPRAMWWGFAHVNHDAVTGRLFTNPTRAYVDGAWAYRIYWSDDSGLTWTDDYSDHYDAPAWTESESTNVVFDDSGVATWMTYDGGANPVSWVVYAPGHGTKFTQEDFAPISILYRANTFSSLDGYIVLFSTREYDSDNSEWDYHPRRIRWTSPGTVDDFIEAGAGTSDLRGTGSILDSRPVNGRIVLFETNVLGSLVPRGIVSDPWDYDVIKDDFKILSNPVVVDEHCFVVGSDGLLWQTDGVTVSEVGSSFDLTEFDDFDETKPTWMTYSSSLKSLLIHRRSASAPHYAYAINLETGTVSQIELAEIVDGGGDAEIPRGIISTSHSVDQRVFSTHTPLSTNTGVITTSEMLTGEIITGVDEHTDNATYDTYYYSDIQTGRLFIASEGDKTSIKHVIINTYNDGSGNYPDVIVMVKSLEDSDWTDAGDSTGTIACTTSTTWVGTGTAWSTLIGRAGTEVDGAETKFVLPCLATQARVYLEVGDTYTLQVEGTDYDNNPDADNVKEIGFDTAPAITKNLHAFWDAEPETRVVAGDYIETDEGFHRITAVGTANEITVDHGLDSGTYAGVHHPAVQMAAGDAELKIGLNKLIEGAQLRIIVVPRGGTGAPTVVKITGISIGHVPQGKKILEATGS